jgi:Tfp pilus assembly protein FimT
MSSRGYSLVEMVVIIGIISTLLILGTLQFDVYLKCYRTEAQTRMIYSELQSARANAIYQRRETRVKLYPTRLEVYSSATDSGAAPIDTQFLSYPITWNNGNNIDFDASGTALNNCSVCLNPVDGSGAVDSIVVGDIRLRIGKKDKGDDCSADNITIK